MAAGIGHYDTRLRLRILNRAGSRRNPIWNKGRIAGILPLPSPQRALVLRLLGWSYRYMIDVQI
jgi:hypothetical protein